MKQMLVIVENSDLSAVATGALLDHARQIEDEARGQKMSIERLNAGAYILQWSGGLNPLGRFLSAAALQRLPVRCLVLDNPEWLTS